jgi:hypothetical protein
MDDLQPTSTGVSQGDTTNLLFRAGLICFSFGAAQAWFMLLSFHLQCVLALFAFGIAAFVLCIKQTLQRRGLFSFFPPRVQQYLSERTFLHFMRSTITKNIPIGDLVALIALPLQQHEFEPILNRLPAGYRRFLLRPLKSFISSNSSSLVETSSSNSIPLELSHEVRIDSEPASSPIRTLVLSSIPQDSSARSESLFTPTAASASTQLRIPPTPVSPALMSPHANSTSLVLAPPPSTDLSAYQSIFAFLAQPSPHLSFGAATKEFVWQRIHSQLTALFRVADLQREGRLEYLTLGAMASLVLHMRVRYDINLLPSLDECHSYLLKLFFLQLGFTPVGSHCCSCARLRWSDCDMDITSTVLVVSQAELSCESTSVVATGRLFALD